MEQHKMTNLIQKIQDITTGETLEVPFTEDEIISYEKVRKEQSDAAKKFEAQAAATATAKAALLSKLGITAEEAALLLS
jgi:hypothetical protein